MAWKTNKQDTVTILSTEAELFAISQIAKKAIYLFWLIKALKLSIFKAFTIKCDNVQTIYLLVDELTKLQTKLRHVNIHSHWLQQKIQRGLIAIQ